MSKTEFSRKIQKDISLMEKSVKLINKNRKAKKKANN